MTSIDLTTIAAVLTETITILKGRATVEDHRYNQQIAAENWLNAGQADGRAEGLRRAASEVSRALTALRVHAARTEPSSEPATDDGRDADRIDTAQEVAAKVDIQWGGRRYPAGPFTVTDPGSSFFVEGPADLANNVLDLALAAFDQELARWAENSNRRRHDDSSTPTGPQSPQETNVEDQGRPGGDSSSLGATSDGGDQS